MTHEEILKSQAIVPLYYKYEIFTIKKANTKHNAHMQPALLWVLGIGEGNLF